MSAYTRWLTEYEPVQARAAALLDECEALRQGPSSPEAAAALRAMLSEAKVYLDQAERWMQQRPAPNVLNELCWSVRDFVRHSPHFPAAVGYAVLALVAVLALLVDRVMVR